MHPLHHHGGYFAGAGDKAGTYIAWLLSENSALLLHDWMQFVGVPNPVPPEDLHCTLAYSPGCFVDESMHGEWHLGTPYGCFDNNDRKISVFGKSEPTIVLEIGGTPIHRRHEFYRDYHGLEHGFPEFKPHVSLTYDAEKFPRDVLQRITSRPFRAPITFDRERIEPLNID